MNRRTFLRSTAAAGVLSTFNFHVLGQDKTGKKYRTALIGCGWWGNNILGEAMSSGACQIVALCDVDQRQLVPTAERVTQLTGDQPKHYQDYRELLEKEKPEVVIVATPDHWHPLQTIAALKSGAHVYVE